MYLSCLAIGAALTCFKPRRMGEAIMFRKSGDDFTKSSARPANSMRARVPERQDHSGVPAASLATPPATN